MIVEVSRSISRYEKLLKGNAFVVLNQKYVSEGIITKSKHREPKET